MAAAAALRRRLTTVRRGIWPLPGGVIAQAAPVASQVGLVLAYKRPLECWPKRADFPPASFGGSLTSRYGSPTLSPPQVELVRFPEGFIAQNSSQPLALGVTTTCAR